MVNELMGDLNRYVMILKGIECKVWNHAHKYPAIARAWFEWGYLNDYKLLSSKGRNIVKLHPLLRYEFNVACQLLDGDEVNTDPANYMMLRTGLKSYFDMYIELNFLHVFKQVYKIGHSETAPAEVLDLGCGAGQYSVALNNLDFPIKLTLMDKSDNHIHLPFTWYQGDITKPSDAFKKQYDYIILNEVIHCLNGEETMGLMQNINDCLKPKGVVIVTEQWESYRMDWRMEKFSNGGKMYSIEEIEKLFKEIYMEQTDFSENINESHYFLTLRRKI